MKLISHLLFCLLGLFSVVIVSCEPETPTNQGSLPVSEEKLPAPFHFQKAIEVKPGLTFDVLSWGRGTDTIGSYLVLRSDSTHEQYTSTSAELEGKILDAWNMDMDADGNPEIFIQIKKNQNPESLALNVHEFNPDGSSQKLKFPDLTEATKKKYRGMDSIYIRDGKLMREFPLFREDTLDTKPEGKKIVEYDLYGNTFTVKEPAQQESQQK